MPGAHIQDFGDAPWWSVALVTTGGRVLGFLLMLYAVGIFPYFVASIATVLVGLDSEQGTKETRREGPRARPRVGETLRRILDSGQG